MTPGFDPVVERVILRCLEKDPKARPRSVAAVAAALPGGDPLAAAIAAGETPSPEMVAAAGGEEGMKPAAAWTCLLLILAGLALTAWLSPRAYRHGHVPLEKPPEVLVERSKEIIRRLGYTEKPLGTAWGFSGNGEYRSWVEEHDKSKSRWKDMEDGRPAAIYFWYRQSPGQLIPERFRGEDFGGVQVTESDPPPMTSGMIGVELDPLGRLIRFEAVPSSGARPASSNALDWSVLLAEAGLDAAALSPSEPQWLPPSYADARAALVESKPERPDRPLRVEAAAVGGRPVFFELAGPWSRPPRTTRPAELTGVGRDFDLLFLGILVVGAALIARRNLRLGRSDRRGAMRLAVLTFAGSMLSWVFLASHVAGDSELTLLLLGASVFLFLAGVSWLLYVALEPLIRRRWPDSLIAWTRLLSGRFSDPLVGRVLLAGALLGVFAAISRELRELALRTFAATPPIPPFPWDTTLRGPRAVASHLSNPAVAMFFALAIAMLYFLLRAVLRKEWLAASAFVLFFAVPSFLDGGPISGAFALVVAAAEILVFLRFGLLALVFSNIFGHSLQFPLTADPSAWYAGTSLFLLVVLAGSRYMVSSSRSPAGRCFPARISKIRRSLMAFRRPLIVAAWILTLAVPLLAQEGFPLFTTDFPPEEFAARRAKVYEAIGTDAFAVVQGAPAPPSYTRFRQSNELYYVCGVEVPHAYLLMDGATKKATLYLPNRNEGREKGEGKLLSAEDAEEVKKLTGVDAVASTDVLAEQIENRYARAGKRILYTPLAPAEGGAMSRDLALRFVADAASDPFDGRPSREGNFTLLLRERFPYFEIRDLSPTLDALRLIKSEREMAVIRKATKLAGLAHPREHAVGPAGPVRAGARRRRASSSSTATAPRATRTTRSSAAATTPTGRTTTPASGRWRTATSS